MTCAVWPCLSVDLQSALLPALPCCVACCCHSVSDLHPPIPSHCCPCVQVCPGSQSFLLLRLFHLHSHNPLCPLTLHSSLPPLQCCTAHRALCTCMAACRSATPPTLAPSYSTKRSVVARLCCTLLIASSSRPRLFEQPQLATSAAATRVLRSLTCQLFSVLDVAPVA